MWFRSLLHMGIMAQLPQSIPISNFVMNRKPYAFPIARNLMAELWF
ncbi:hypothetical protein D791_02544 [Nitrincola nitratireducens]|uniref:Uncharacterized protein n=1 Tax=Nitrincola nitratireducens TaxID=1229521 RepID=W9UTS0_9GAMM|nr:hypothetical protein D791_02544 [Nitrincola nitratireducens]